MNESEAVATPTGWGTILASARALVLEYMIVFVVAALFIVLALTSPAFVTTHNFENILSQNAPIGIVACGITLVIIAGGFDLSVGAIFSLAGVVAAWAALHIDPVLGLFAGVFAAALVGAVNGFAVVVLKVNSFLATLASSLMIGGIALAITGGFLINVSDLASFVYIGNESLFGLQYSVYFFFATAIILGVVLRSTAFGRHIYAVGGNLEAARLSGLRVGLIRAMTFVICGLTAGIAGVLAASKGGAGQPNVELDLALNAIAAVVLGGTSISGGEGAMWRTVLGVLLLALIVNGFNLLNVQPEFRQLITGAIIIAAVALNTRASGSRG
jgi:ribose transport system permease protein